MIDGTKSLSIAVTRETFLNNPLIEPYIPRTNTKTGEMENEPEEAKYKGLKFSIYENRIQLDGSLHTFYNDGFHNYNDFYFRMLESVILDWKHNFGIDIERTRINNLEIGVNIVLPYKPEKALNNTINHRGTPFTWAHEKTKRYRECSHTQFFIKFYDKGIQYKLNKYILRFEVKFIKMERINDLGIKTFADLIKPGNLEKLGELLLNIFDELLMGNLKANTSQLNKRDKELFDRGHNDRHWTELKPDREEHDPKEYNRLLKQYERKLKRFKELLKETGADQQKNEIRKLIEQKINDLCNPEKTGENDQEYLQEKRGKMTDTKAEKRPGKKTPGRNQKTGENDRLFYSVKNGHPANPKNLKCLLTKIDISKQKKGSKFLSVKTARQIKETDPVKFKELVKLYASKHKKQSIEKKCYFIAHNIRNQFYNNQNKKVNTRGG